MSEEEGPFGENNARFCISRSTLMKHFDNKPKPWTSFDIIKQAYIRNSFGINDHTYRFRGFLEINGHRYRLRGFIGGETGENFLADTSLQWIEFKNHALSHSTPCKHWSCVLLPPSLSDIRDIVNLEIHETSLLHITPAGSGS